MRSLLLLLFLASCTAPECREESLPRPIATDSLEDLWVLAKHAEKHDCCGVMYQLFSRATHDANKWGETGFCVKWRSLPLEDPDGEQVKLVDVVRGGEWLDLAASR